MNAYKKEMAKINTQEKLIKSIERFTPENAANEQKAAIKRVLVAEYMKNVTKELSKQKKEAEKLNATVFDVASKAVSHVGEIDEPLRKEIMKLQSYYDKFTYYDKAVHSQKLINYTIWRLTDKSPDINLYSSLEKDEREFINAVCSMVLCKPIYPTDGELDLTLYDPFMSGWNDQKFIVSVDAIKKLRSISFINKVNATIGNSSTTTSTPNPTPTDLKSPIHMNFVHNDDFRDPNLAIDVDLKNHFDTFFKEYLYGRDYYYEKTDNPLFYKLYVKNSIGVPEGHTIVYGYHGKGIPSILVTNIFGDTLAVHPKCEDAINATLSNCFYQFTEQETTYVSMFRTPYFWIFNLLDLSDTDDSMIDALANKLNIVFGAIQNSGVVLTPNVRYRFEEFDSVDRFLLMSDDKVNNYFNSAIDGSIIIVEENSVMYKINNQINTIKI